RRSRALHLWLLWRGHRVLAQRGEAPPAEPVSRCAHRPARDAQSPDIYAVFSGCKHHPDRSSDHDRTDHTNHWPRRTELGSDSGMSAVDWQLKVDAFLSRAPGEATVRTTD